MTEGERDQMLRRIEEQQRMILTALERGGLLPSPALSNAAQETADAQRLATIYREQGRKAFLEAQRKCGPRRARRAG